MNKLKIDLKSSAGKLLSKENEAKREAPSGQIPYRLPLQRYAKIV